MGVTDEIKQRTDILEVVGQYVSLTKSGKTFKGLCPFHSEKDPSFFVYPEQQTWHCFGACNAGGDIFSFLMRKEGVDFGDALRLLAQRAGVVVPSRSEPGAGKDEKERLYQANAAAAQYFHNLLISSPAGENARKYLVSRGLSQEAVADFQLGFSLDSWDALKQYLTGRGYAENELLAAGLLIETDDKRTLDRFRNRLIFPIFDIKGRITGFGARALDDSHPKYLNSPQTGIFDKSGSLYGINLAHAAIRQQNLAVVVEGYTDVIAAHQYGFNNVVASMGTSVTEKQIASEDTETEDASKQVISIKKLTKNLVLALDADAAGEKAMLRCIDYENALGAEVKVIVFPEGKDPDNVIRENPDLWRELLKKALPVIDYTFDVVASEFDLSTANGSDLALQRLLPIIAKIKVDTRRDRYLRKLEKVTGIGYPKLEAALSRLMPDRRVKESKRMAIARAIQPLRSNPLEENCLALLLKHPELKARSQEISPEYFESSDNREIFLAWQNVDDVSSLKDTLDHTIHDKLNSLLNKSIPEGQTEEKYAYYVSRLKVMFFRSLEAKREAQFAQEAETKGAGADLVKLQEQGMEVSVQLGEVFTQSRHRGGQEPRR